MGKVSSVHRNPYLSGRNSGPVMHREASGIVRYYKLISTLEQTKAAMELGTSRMGKKRL